MRVDEIVEAAQLVQAVLAAKFVEARNTMFAIANDVKGCDVDLPCRAVESRQTNVLHELRDVVQRQEAEALAAHA